MSHDFLAALHVDAAASTAKGSASVAVIKGPETEATLKSEQAAVKERDAAPLLAPEERHRTVGVSMSPALRRQAAARAKALGLPFSRYVAWCVEAELEGRPPQARFERSPPPERSIGS